MKKIFVTILLFSLLLQVNAGRKFYKIGNYTKVEILKITAKGIQVLHSYGIGYITDENLSESEKKLLQPEIEQYHKLKNIRVANIEKITNSQTQELDDLIKRLPGMKYNELQAWSKKRVGVYIPHKQFEEKYSQTFYFAKNKSLFYKMLIKKVKTLQTEKLNDLTKNLPKMSLKETQVWCKKNTGFYLTNKHFFAIFNTVFSLVENKDSCLKQLRSKAQQIHNESLDEFSKKMCKMSLNEINIYCQKTFRIRYSYQKLKEKLEENFYLASNIKNAVNRIDRHISNQRMKPLMSNFGNLVNQTMSQKTLNDNALRSLIQLRNQAKYIKEQCSLSDAQEEFIEYLSNAGKWADLYFGNIKLATIFTNTNDFNRSNQSINEARKSKENAMKMLVGAIRVYNNL